MSIYFFNDTRDPFNNFLMEIEPADVEIDVNELVAEFRALAKGKDEVYFTPAHFQKFLNDKGVSNQFLYGASEIVWR